MYMQTCAVWHDTRRTLLDVPIGRNAGNQDNHDGTNMFLTSVYFYVNNSRLGLAGLAYICVFVVFEEDIPLELSAANAHATDRDARGWRLEIRLCSVNANLRKQLWTNSPAREPSLC